MALSGDQISGFVGSLVGAAMESAGQHVQSQLLDILGGSPGKMLGGALYLTGIMAALFCIASGASYRFGRWLLIGPALFFFLVTQRVDSQGAEWRFGERTHDRSEVEQATARVMGGTSIGRVSYFFAVWNRMTSEIVQDLIKLLHLTKKKSDLDFIGKGDRYLELFGQHLSDPLLLGFLQISLVNRCSNYYALLRVVNDPTVPGNQKQGAQKVLDGMNKDELVFNRSEFPWWNHWLAAVAGPTAAKYKDKLLFSCQDLWELAIALVKEPAAQIVNNIARLNIPRGLTAEDVLKRLREKAGQRIGNGDVLGGGAGGSDGLQILINELTVRLVMKELSILRQPLAAMDMNEHPQVMEGEAGRKTDQETTRAIRELQAADEYYHKGELIAGALTLPYIQGMVLYFLAMSFPFFALMVIVPGRHGAVLTWMSLWLWVKLWDLGVAVVMMIDNILYTLLPHGPPINDGDLAQPGRVINLILQVDPTFAVHTYYNVLSCCLFAVPVVTGFLVHKGGSEIVSGVTEGFKEFPTVFGNSMASFQKAMKVQENIAAVNRHIYNETVKAGWESVVNDPEILKAMTDVWKGRLAQGTLDQVESLIKSSASVSDKVAKLKDLVGTDAMKSIESARIDANISHNQQLAIAKLRANMGMAAYHASVSDFSIGLAGKNVGLGMNSHDQSLQLPVADLVAVEQARRFYPMGQVYDTALTEMMKKFAGKDKGGK